MKTMGTVTNKEQMQAQRVIFGMELDCRQRLRRVSNTLAGAVEDPGASALKTREWLERELREMRDDEARELVKQFAGYTERMRKQMELMLNIILDATQRSEAKQSQGTK